MPSWIFKLTRASWKGVKFWCRCSARCFLPTRWHVLASSWKLPCLCVLRDVLKRVHLATIILHTLLSPTSSLGVPSWSTKGCKWSSRSSTGKDTCRNRGLEDPPCFLSPLQARKRNRDADLKGKEEGNGKASHYRKYGKEDKVGFRWAWWQSEKRGENRREGGGCSSWGDIQQWRVRQFPYHGEDRISRK